METHRLFIAISPPEPVMDEIAKAQAELQQALPGNFIRWTKREQFHLTLRFLGKVEISKSEALIRALREAGLAFAPLRLRAEGMGCFPNSQFPRVLWIGAHDAPDTLQTLHQLVDAAVAGFTVEKAETRFIGHVTLARVQNIRRPQAELLARVAASMSERLFGEWVADKIEIFRSELAPGGAKHSVLAEIPLAEDRQKSGFSR